MKKFLRALFFSVFVMSLASCAFAEYYNEGHTGTAADPYIIDSNADLVDLRDRVNDTKNPEPGDKYYKLTQNLTLSSYTNWVPIGTDKNPFTGHFDGNNLAIQVNMVDARSITGLFGTITTTEGYSVRNLKVSGTVKGQIAGGIISKLNSGNVENCSFNGTIEDHIYGEHYGGIIAYMAGGTVKNSSSSGNIVSNYNNNGGIVGCMTGGSIENCSSTANVIARSNNESTCAGGIVGYAQGSDFTAVKDCTFSGGVYSRRYSGGIVGYMSSGNLQRNHITASTNSNSLIVGEYVAGGIAGRIGDSITLESCDVVLGTVISSDNEAAGGIVGLVNNNSTVRNNTSYATISGKTANRGGVIGKVNAATSTLNGNKYSNAEHGVGSDDNGQPSERGCTKIGVKITITTGENLTAYVNTEYSLALATDTGNPTWSFAKGTTLPDGLTLNSGTGVISGTPKTAGTYKFTIQATVGSSVATKDFTLTVEKAGEITITTGANLSGVVNQTYSLTLEKTPAGSATWTLINSTKLPDGLTLNASTGVISGTPKTAGTYNFTIQAQSGNSVGKKVFTMTITNAATVTITTTSLPSGIAGKSYAASLSATPVNSEWSYTGNFPAGLTLSTSGNISGTPTKAGTYNFTVVAKSGNLTASKALSIVISPLEITTSSLPNGTVGEAYSQTLKSNGENLTWTVSEGTLPSGLNLNSTTGALSGTPNVDDYYLFKIRAYNSYASAEKSFSITIYDNDDYDYDYDYDDGYDDYDDDPGHSSGGGGCNQNSVSGFLILSAGLMVMMLKKR